MVEIKFYCLIYTIIELLTMVKGKEMNYCFIVTVPKKFTWLYKFLSCIHPICRDIVLGGARHINISLLLTSWPMLDSFHTFLYSVSKEKYELFLFRIFRFWASFILLLLNWYCVLLIFDLIFKTELSKKKFIYFIVVTYYWKC